MRTKIFNIIFCVAVSVSQASAQQNLVVYHVSGNVNIISGNQTLAALRGSTVSKNSNLEVKNNSSCMLIAENGNSLQMKDPGIYSFDDLQKQLVKEKTDDVTSKFFKYVYKKMFAPKTAEPMGITPVVFRGDKLMLVPSNNTIIVSNAATFRWKKPIMKTPLRLTIKNDGQKVIFDSVIKIGTAIHVDFNKAGITPKHVYQWKIEESDTRQPINYFTHFLVAEKKDAQKIKSDIRLAQDKKLPTNLKMQMDEDIFEKWRQFYLN